MSNRVADERDGADGPGGIGMPDGFQRLWSPHRLAYIKGENRASGTGPEGCPFCLIPEMPDEDGLSLMRRIRARPPDRGGAVPSIALSAYTRPEDQRAALAAGFDEFLSKPAIPADVARVVERCMASGH